jgi:hypothetical protein
MILFKIFLIVIVILALRAYLIQKSLLLTERLIALVLFIGVVLLVLFPDKSTVVAEAVGVGRGVDLVIYLSLAFLLFLSIGVRRRFRQLNSSITELSRTIAIITAHRPDDTSNDKNPSE